MLFSQPDLTFEPGVTTKYGLQYGICERMRDEEGTGKQHSRVLHYSRSNHRTITQTVQSHWAGLGICFSMASGLIQLAKIEKDRSNTIDRRAFPTCLILFEACGFLHSKAIQPYVCHKKNVQSCVLWHNHPFAGFMRMTPSADRDEST